MRFWLFLILIALLSSFVYAAPLVQTFPDVTPELTVTANTNIYGEGIQMGISQLTLTKVYVHSASTAGRVCIYINDSGLSPLECSTTHSGDDFTFNFVLNASTAYIIAADNVGATWTAKYNLSTSINGIKNPRETAYMNYTQNLYSTYGATPTWTNIDGWSTIYALEFINPFSYLFGCTGLANDTIAYNFTIYNELDGKILYSDVAADINYLGENTSLQLLNVTSITICALNGTSFYTNGVLYITTNNNLNKYYLVDDLYTNYTKNISLYNIPYPVTLGGNTSTLTVTLKDAYYNSYPDIIGKLSRYYPNNHSWIVVQMDKSDLFGRLFYEVIEQDVEYKLDFYDGSTYLDGTNTMKFLCSLNQCDILFQIFPSTNATQATAINYSYDNATKFFNINFVDSTGTMTYIEVILDKDTITGTTHICDTNSTLTSGTITCNATGYSGQVLLKVISSKTAPKYELYQFVDLGSDTLGSAVGLQESGLWIAGLSITIATIGLFSPVGVILMFVASLWIISFLGFSNIITLSFLIISTCMGLFISFKVKT